MGEKVGVAIEDLPESKKKLLFWACWFALVATSFGFVVRSFLIDTFGQQFALTETQKGEILGVGLWPFAISIILFSLVVDRIGYGRAMVFAFVCHVLSVVLTVTATGYWQLYVATFIVALANGTVEAVVNPVVATLFPQEKTKYLNYLHAGWPGGLVLGGLLALLMGPETDWRYKVALILLPTALYGIMMLGCKFPVHERVAAGIPYMEMLKEFGFLGALIVNFMMFTEVGRVFGFPGWLTGIIIVLATLGFGAVVKWAPGRPLFIFLLLVMIPLATTELGTDTWVTSLMQPEMEKLGAQAGWLLVYTSFIMMVLRFCAGPIVHRLSPLGLLAVCSALAMLGLIFLSKAAGAAILLAATLYGVGKTFFWPTMLGVVAERFPRGGALTLNAIGGAGMLGVGVVGAVFLGYIQDTSVSNHLQQAKPAVHAQVSVEKPWAFGQYTAVDPEKLQSLPPSDRAEIEALSQDAKKSALATVAIFPGIMLICYLVLIAYFRSKGGYRAVSIEEAAAEKSS
ncbi:MAG: MFS transporter [Armatimonadota bacterium]|nr:MFS transporter [Armatimonadota bacterium]